MNNNMWKKELVLGIIVLFVGASVVSSIDGNNTLELPTAEDVEAITVNLGGKNVEEQIMVDNEGVSSGVLDVYWWSMFRHDLNHTGYSTSTVEDYLVPVWTCETGGGVPSSPAVADGKVYIGSWDGKVYCLNATSGNVIWTRETGLGVQSSPAVADGKVYIGSLDGKVYCLNATNGDIIWTYETGHFVHSSPAVADGKVYIGSLDGKVYAFGPDIVSPDCEMINPKEKYIHIMGRPVIPFFTTWSLSALIGITVQVDADDPGFGKEGIGHVWIYIDGEKMPDGAVYSNWSRYWEWAWVKMQWVPRYYTLEAKVLDKAGNECSTGELNVLYFNPRMPWP